MGKLPSCIACMHETRTALQVEKLLEQYDSIAVGLPEAAALSEKHAAATAWAAEAQAVLDRGRHFADEDARMLEVCICCVPGGLQTNVSLFRRYLLTPLQT